MSIIETAKRNNLDVYGYLLYLLTVLPEMGTDPTEDQIKSVMPWSFALPTYCRQTYSEIQLALHCFIQFRTFCVTLIHLEPRMFLGSFLYEVS